MKHLSNLLLIVFLSYPIFIDSKIAETLYLWETSSGKVWRGFGDKETHPKYKGEVNNGEPNGLGFIIYPSGSKYVGEWKNGLPDGKGIDNSFNGTSYSGEWKNGKYEGKGRFKYSN